jgi:hypothetical protein
MTRKGALTVGISTVILIFLVCVPSVFLTRWKDNLHCTQRTSFSIVLFDWQPHIEDKPIAPIYYKPWGLVIRFLVACLTIVSLYAPAVAYSLSLIRRKRAYLLWITGVFVATLFLFVSSPLGGERASSLAVTTVLLCLPLYSIALFFIWLSRRKG